MTTFEGLDRPWRILERYTGPVEARDLALGGAYVAFAAVTEEGRRLAANDRDQIRSAT